MSAFITAANASLVVANRFFSHFNCFALKHCKQTRSFAWHLVLNTLTLHFPHCIIVCPHKNPQVQLQRMSAPLFVRSDLLLGFVPAAEETITSSLCRFAPLFDLTEPNILSQKLANEQFTDLQ
jgi:hypothetical protein